MTLILSGFYTRFLCLQEIGANRQFSLPTASLVCCLLLTLLLGLFPMRLGPPKQTREQTFFIKLSRFHYIFIYSPIRH